ncbi:hypothetical protein BBOV_I002110 [Babesia bovis T2Bo]|uniref:Condensin complex subunit 1 C-terminal domain-containing protein n=1 Tax=Babesia bovis TaxID=5865 RepID=A7AW66_BABBO|nr:hypothetical protein BBOV_I002110 [Babesia bovis T2Bo]EDO05294.1 hypothetical protein BBOV_I002110 [Babesia bovis T2Bo]|eukprot:XP_001608862.1 hypothetical protein [Babesia bovis T2Bo]
MRDVEDIGKPAKRGRRHPVTDSLKRKVRKSRTKQVINETENKESSTIDDGDEMITEVPQMNVLEGLLSGTLDVEWYPAATTNHSVTKNDNEEDSDDGCESPNKDLKLSLHASAYTLKKLEVYKTAYIICMTRIIEDRIPAEEALPMMSLPLKEVIESILNTRATTDATMDKKFEYLADAIYTNSVLSLCYVMESKISSDTETIVHAMTDFIYRNAMRADYLMTNHSTLKTPMAMNIERLIPKIPLIVYRIWDTVLQLCYARERRYRHVFVNATQAIMKNVLIDSVGIPRGLLNKYVDTFGSLLADPNKDIRCKCIELLSKVQDGKVMNEIVKHIGDANANVRLAALTGTAVPHNIDAVVPILIQLISHLGDVDKDVRIGVYNKLASTYALIPVELCMQIMYYGSQEKNKEVQSAYLQMLEYWIDESGDITGFITDMISHADDITPLENAIGLIMQNTDFYTKVSNQSSARNHMFTQENIASYMVRFKSLTPGELVLLSVFYQNTSLPEERRLINVVDVISYAHFLLTQLCDMPADSDEAPQRAITANSDDETQFMDARENNQSNILHQYTPSEEITMKGHYTNTSLVSHGLRSLAIILHYHEIEDAYQVALVENICDKILLYGPVRGNIKGLMTDVISQTTLGNNSFSDALPSKWLKSGFTFTAISLLRYVYARKFKIEGMFIGDDPKNEKMNYEKVITRKLLTIISDINDPFQTSGISNISIRREDLERMEMDKIKMFDPTKYSIEHLNLLNAKLEEQMDQTITQQAELANVMSVSREGHIEKKALEIQKEALESILEKQQAFADVIRSHLKLRWSRIMAIVEAFLAQTQSICPEDPGLTDFPRAILLPQMSFFCSTVVRWRNQSITDQYCDVLTSKCLATWCMLNKGKIELSRQLNAFYVALKGALSILEGLLTQSQEANHKNDEAHKRRIEVQTLRCEMYLVTLTDLLLVNVDIHQKAAPEFNVDENIVEDIKDVIWGIVFCTVKTSKYVQSLAIRMALKLVLTESMTIKNVESDMKSDDKSTVMDELAVLRLRGMLELVFIAPTTERRCISEFKFIQNDLHTHITPEDKQAIASTCALYPTLSYRHLRNFHKVLEQVLMRSIHHALLLDLKMSGFTQLITFIIQTIMHKSPLYFSLESLAKYFKWIMLITIDKGPVLADKGGFVQFINSIIAMFIKQDVTKLVEKLGALDKYNIVEGDKKSMSDICAMENPQVALMDLRDMRVLLTYMEKGGFVKSKNNLKVINDLVQMITGQLQKIAKQYHSTLRDTKDAVVVDNSTTIKVKYAINDTKAFANLVDAYDAYLSNLVSREMCAMVIPNEGRTKNSITTEITKPSGKLNHSTKPSQQVLSDIQENDEDQTDEDYVE